MTAIDSWKLLKSYHFVELWKTPTKYLVCYKYGGIFHFVDTFEEGVKLIKPVYDQSLASLK